MSILRPLQGKNPHQAEPISNFAGCSHVSGVVQSKSTQVLPTAASLVLLDPTELPAPKKEKRWRMVEQVVAVPLRKKRGVCNTTNVRKCSVSTG